LNYLYLMTDCQSWKALQKNLSMNYHFIWSVKESLSSDLRNKRMSG
jgi:hypothetical protein